MKTTALILLIAFSSCSKDKECQTNAANRSGAKCKDGTSSSATGSGACSGHGGVDYWICK